MKTEIATRIQCSGFADEIDASLDKQLQVVAGLGMRYITLRTADGKGIADYTAQQVQEQLMPRLNAADIGVSCLGSPIGKVQIDDDEAFQKQCSQLEQLCQCAKLLGCGAIRVFSFYIPLHQDPALHRGAVLAKLGQFIAIAERHQIVLLHENEKDIYGDTLQRCLDLMQALHSPYFKAAFDFANFVQCGQDTLTCWQQLAPYVADIHIKDAIRGKGENVLCGTGDGKIAQILHRAIFQDGFTGFLTLEPHLVLFDALQSLELSDAQEIIHENKAKNGTEGYTLQYHALLDILEQL